MMEKYWYYFDNSMKNYNFRKLRFYYWRKGDHLKAIQMFLIAMLYKPLALDPRWLLKYATKDFRSIIETISFFSNKMQ